MKLLCAIHCVRLVDQWPADNITMLITPENCSNNLVMILSPGHCILISRPLIGQPSCMLASDWLTGSQNTLRRQHLGQCQGLELLSVSHAWVSGAEMTDQARQGDRGI